MLTAILVCYGVAHSVTLATIVDQGAAMNQVQPFVAREASEATYQCYPHGWHVTVLRR